MAAKIWIVQNPLQTVSEGVRIPRFHEQPVLSTPNQFRDSADPGCNDAHPGCHPLQHGVPEGLLPDCRVNEYVGFAKKVWHVVPKAQKGDVILDTERFAEAHQTLLHGTGARHRKLPGSGDQSSDCFQKDVHALLRDERCDGEDSQDPLGRRCRVWVEAFGIHTVIDRAGPPFGKAEPTLGGGANVIGDSRELVNAGKGDAVQ